MRYAAVAASAQALSYGVFAGLIVTVLASLPQLAVIAGSAHHRSVLSVRAVIAARGPGRGAGGPWGASVAVAVIAAWPLYLFEASALR